MWLPTASLTRSLPPSFGGFASKYIKGRFFMDVHPPLAKMLIALCGWLAGFNGDFDFKDIGKDYLAPGVQGINYWGVSYGTMLGITFVNSELLSFSFPAYPADRIPVFSERVGRVVLDGCMGKYLRPCSGRPHT